MSTAKQLGSSPWRRGRPPALAALLAGSLTVAYATAPTPGEAGTWLKEWIDRWLGNPPIATGGTKGGSSSPSICLLHPWLLPDNSPPRANLTVPRPLLAATRPLSKIELTDDNGHSLGEASPPRSTNSAGTLMAWPRHWPSLEPGRRYELILKAASTDASATVVLQAASAEAFLQTRRLQERLGNDPERWEQKIQALLTTSAPPSDQSRALAAQLLFSPQLLISPQIPPSPALEQLRQALRRANCSTPPQASHLPGAPL